MHIRILCLLALTLTLGACDTLKEQFTDLPKQVAVLQTSLATAEHSALLYASLPVCGKTIAKLCRNPEITKKIKEADDKAYIAVMAAHDAMDETTIQAAGTAMNTLQTLTNGLPQ